jgi:hypothetical protein
MEIMGRASHKLAGSYLTIHTTTAPAELLGLSETIALQVFKRRPDKPGPIVKTGRADTSVDFAVTNLWKKAVMRFGVRVARTADGGTDLRSQITFFTTRQEQLLGFIPVGPKKLVGWNAYSTFMNTLQVTVQDADRAAQAAIVTVAG